MRRANMVPHRFLSLSQTYSFADLTIAADGTGGKSKLVRAFLADAAHDKQLLLDNVG